MLATVSRLQHMASAGQVQSVANGLVCNTIGGMGREYTKEQPSRTALRDIFNRTKLALPLHDESAAG